MRPSLTAQANSDLAMDSLKSGCLLAVVLQSISVSKVCFCDWRYWIASQRYCVNQGRASRRIIPEVSENILKLFYIYKN